MKVVSLENAHQLDLTIGQSASIDLLVEELPDSVLFASDCASSAASVSSASSLGCGSFSSAGSFSSMGSVTSSGG